MNLKINLENFSYECNAEYLIKNNDFIFATDCYKAYKTIDPSKTNSFASEALKANASFMVIYPHKKVLLVFVDPLGLETLYYNIENNNIFISSNCLDVFKLADSLEHSINEKYIGVYLTGVTDNLRNPFPNQTIFTKINQIEYGSYLKIETKKILITKYWNGSILNHNSNGINLVSCNEYKENIINIIKNDIVDNTVEGNIASLLSGGLDSTCIVGILNDLFESNKLHTISLVYPKDKAADESSIILDVINRFKLANFHFINADIYNSLDNLNMNQVSFSVDMDWFYKQYYEISKLVRKCNCRTLYDGLGGDELFGINYSKSFFSVECPDYITKDFLYDTGFLDEIYNKEIEREILVEKYKNIDYKRLCVILKGIEPRYIQYRKSVYCDGKFNWNYPFLNPSLIEYVISNYSDENSNEGYKYILKKIFPNYISDNQYNNRIGGDYSLPIINGFKNNINLISDLIYNGILIKKGIVSKKKINSSLNLMKKDFDLWFKLNNYFTGIDLIWNYITYEIWYKKVVAEMNW